VQSPTSQDASLLGWSSYSAKRIIQALAAFYAATSHYASARFTFSMASSISAVFL